MKRFRREKLCRDTYLAMTVVLQPDPLKNWKEGLGDRLGWKCTVRPECRHASDWFHDCMPTAVRVFIENTHRNTLV